MFFGHFKMTGVPGGVGDWISVGHHAAVIPVVGGWAFAFTVIPFGDNWR